ncbi:MAG: hypothetical protein AAFR16_00330 [Pseudomonadota bacterium]
MATTNGFTAVGKAICAGAALGAAALAAAPAQAAWQERALAKGVHAATVEGREMALVVACREGAGASLSVTVVSARAAPAFQNRGGPMASFRFDGEGQAARHRYLATALDAAGPNLAYAVAAGPEDGARLVRRLRAANEVTVTLVGGASADSATGVRDTLSLKGSSVALRRMRARCR